MRVTRFHADEPFDHYRHTLEKLGAAKGLFGLDVGKMRDNSLQAKGCPEIPCLRQTR